MYYVSQARFYTFYTWGDCGMGSLLGLLKMGRKIPSCEFSKEVSAKARKRPKEMAILGRIIPKKKILEIHKKRGHCISRGFDPTATKIKFQVTNGTVHYIDVSCEDGELKVVDSGNVLYIDTTEGLREYILNILGVE